MALLTHGDPMELRHAQSQCKILEYAQRFLGKVGSDYARLATKLAQTIHYSAEKEHFNGLKACVYVGLEH